MQHEDAIPIQVKDQTIPCKETVDEFLARGGKINRVPQGASGVHHTPLTMRKRVTQQVMEHGK